MNDPAASFNFPLFSFLQQLLVICTLFSAQPQHVVPAKGEMAERILYILKGFKWKTRYKRTRKMIGFSFVFNRAV